MSTKKLQPKKKKLNRSILSDALKVTGWSQAELARKLGWTRQRVNNLMLRGHFPFSKLWLLRDALPLSDDEFMRFLDRYFRQ